MGTMTVRPGDTLSGIASQYGVDLDALEQANPQLDDPKMFTRPWTVSVPLHRESGYRIYEYACHEGNHAVEGILRGARVRETR